MDLFLKFGRFLFPGTYFALQFRHMRASQGEIGSDTVHGTNHRGEGNDVVRGQWNCNSSCNLTFELLQVQIVRKC